MKRFKFKFDLTSKEDNGTKVIEIYENDFYSVKKIYYRIPDYILFTIKSKDPSLPELIIKEENLKAVDVKINFDIKNPVSIKDMHEIVENANVALISASKIKKLL